MENRLVLQNDMLLLASNFQKIIEVNLAEDTYYAVKVAEHERVQYNGVMKWAREFCIKNVHSEDVGSFLRFFESFSNIEKFSKKQILFYRRYSPEGWKMVCTEVIPMPNFSIDDPIVLILVRDIDDYVKEYKRQIN